MARETGEMFAVLAEALRALPELVADGEGWSSLDVDYEPPRVERLWRPLDAGPAALVYLHKLHPAKSALFHPHPWPSAVQILSGRYVMGIGYGPGRTPPPVAATVTLGRGAIYEMIEPDGWHYVRPLTTVLSVMVTGAPWPRWSPTPDKALRALPPERVQELLSEFGLHLRMRKEGL